MKVGKNSHQSDVYSAGLLATAPGGHGTEYATKPPTLTRPEQADAWVAERVAEGSHFIKIVIDSGIPERPFHSLDEPTVRALVVATHARGKLAIAHIRTFADAQMAVRAGADGLAHWIRDEDVNRDQMAAFVATMKQQKVFVVPTLSVLQSVAGMAPGELIDDKRITGSMSPAALGMLKRPMGKAPRPEAMQHTLLTLTDLIRAGVPVLVGTDAGNNGTLWGASMHHELLMLTQAGMTPLQALNAATALPAHVFGLVDRGRIKNGLKADLMLVRGQPDVQITDSRNVDMVWKDGVLAYPVASKDTAKTQAPAPAVPGDVDDKAYANMLLKASDGQYQVYSSDLNRLAGPSALGVHVKGDLIRLNKPETFPHMFYVCIAPRDIDAGRSCINFAIVEQSDKTDVNVEIHTEGWSGAHKSIGLTLPFDKTFDVVVRADGRRARYSVNGVQVFEHTTPFDPKRFTFLCGSMDCRLRLYEIDE